MQVNVLWPSDTWMSGLVPNGFLAWSPVLGSYGLSSQLFGGMWPALFNLGLFESFGYSRERPDWGLGGSSELGMLFRTAAGEGFRKERCRVPGGTIWSDVSCVSDNRISQAVSRALQRKPHTAGFCCLAQARTSLSSLYTTASAFCPCGCADSESKRILAQAWLGMASLKKCC